MLPLKDGIRQPRKLVFASLWKVVLCYTSSVNKSLSMKGDVRLFNFSAEHSALIDPVSSFLIVVFQRGNESELGIVERNFYKQPTLSLFRHPKSRKCFFFLPSDIYPYKRFGLVSKNALQGSSSARSAELSNQRICFHPPSLD